MGDTEAGDTPLAELDDDRDREELRRRYGMLLQELRVVLPGVQVLLAFLLTVPFASGFDHLDGRGRALFAVSLTASFVAVALLLAPPVSHRSADRRARRWRLALAIRMATLGYSVLAVALLAGLWCVTRQVFGGATGAVTSGVAAVLVIVVWVVLPRIGDRR